MSTPTRFPSFRNHRLSLALAWLLVSCATVNPAANTPPPPTPLTLQLPWTHDYEFTSFYAAEQNGYFASQNLAVTFKTGGFQAGTFINPIDIVLSGKADFGVMDAYNLILARAKGQPVVAVAVLFQRSPSSIISLRSSNISRPQDLIGKRVAITAGGVTWTYTAMLATQGITLEQMEVVPRKAAGIAPLLNGEVDAMTGWVINEGIQVQEAGQDANFIVMGDYGVDAYQHVIFTTEKMIAEHPETVERLLRAVLAGLQDTLAHPDETATLILRYNNTLDLGGQRRRLQAALPFINPAGSTPLAMQAEGWAATQQTMLDQGALAKPIKLEDAYTRAFLQKITGP